MSSINKFSCTKFFKNRILIPSITIDWIMNYLAHLFLSPHHEDWQLGSLLGDFIKGPINEQLKTVHGWNVVNGIKLHRKIDAFSGQSNIFKRSAARINPTYKRFSGILIDMYFDHIIAKHWSQLHETGLSEFSDYVYEVVLKDRPENPQNFRRVAQLIISEDWFRAYTSIDGITRQIERLGSRLKRGNALLGGAKDLSNQLSYFETDFFDFIREAEDFTKDYITKLELAPYSR